MVDKKRGAAIQGISFLHLKVETYGKPLRKLNAVTAELESAVDSIAKKAQEGAVTADIRLL